MSGRRLWECEYCMSVLEVCSSRVSEGWRSSELEPGTGFGE